MEAFVNTFFYIFVGYLRFLVAFKRFLLKNAIKEKNFDQKSYIAITVTSGQYGKPSTAVIKKNKTILKS